MKAPRITTAAAAGILLALWPFGADAAQVRLDVPRCPLAIEAIFPQPLGKPVLADDVRQSMQANKARKGIVGKVLEFPSVMVAKGFPVVFNVLTLGSIADRQGRVTPQMFASIRDEARRAAVSFPQIPKGADHYSEQLRRGSEQVHGTAIEVDKPVMLELIEISDASFALLGAVGGHRVSALNVTRFDLVEGCLLASYLDLPLRMGIARVRAIVGKIRLQSSP